MLAEEGRVSNVGRVRAFCRLRAEKEPDRFSCSHRCLLIGTLVRSAFVLSTQARSAAISRRIHESSLGRGGFQMVTPEESGSVHAQE